MEVISRMERSIDECTDMGNPPDDALIFWDNAVAFYTGSQINDENGVFLFHLADSRCLSASTCGEDGNDNDGTAWVNFQVLRNFEAGQQHILERNCAATRKNKEEIVRLMTIPLIQGSLHRTRMLEDEEDNYERHAGEAAVYAASVLPFIHACSPDDAKIIHANLKASTSENGVDFEDVRNAFARNLPCLGITCDEIGDVLELDSNEGACLRAKSSMTATNGLEVESSNHTSAVILYSFLTIAAIAICYLAYKTSTNNRKQSIEKEITFRRSVSGSRLGDDRKFKAKDYVPQYWQDVENRRDGSNLKENQDEVVTGEML